MDQTIKKTLVLGASPNPERASYEALVSLINKSIPVVAVGRREYSSGNITIHKVLPPGTGDIHTVTLYLGPSNQAEFYELILKLNPRRIIFNPGTYNPEFMSMASSRGIQVVEACTLVLLKTGRY